MIAHVLRLGVVVDLVGHLIIIDADVLRRLTVRVVVGRSTSVVAEVAERRGSLHHIAQARQHELRVAGGDGSLDGNSAIGEDGVDDVLHKAEVIGGEEPVLLFHEPLPVAVATFQACSVECLAFDGVGYCDAAVGILHHLMVPDTVFQVVQSVGIPVLVSPVVVVHPGTEGVEPRTAALVEYLLAAVGKAVDDAVVVVKHHREVIAADVDHLVGLLNADLALHLLRCLGRCRLYQQLLVGLHISCFGPGHIMLQPELDIDEILAAVVQLIRVQAGNPHRLV